MARIPRISSIAAPHSATAFADGIAIAKTAGAIGVAGIITIKSITPKTIKTKR